MSARLIYASAVPGIARVRVTYSTLWSEYQVRLYRSPAGTVPDHEVGPVRGEELIGEYFTDDRTDAIGTAQLMLESTRVDVVGTAQLMIHSMRVEA